MFDDEPEAWPEPDRPAPPDPADYCPACGKPLNQCRAWNEGDHNWQDLL